MSNRSVKKWPKNLLSGKTFNGFTISILMIVGCKLDSGVT